MRLPIGVALSALLILGPQPIGQRAQQPLFVRSSSFGVGTAPADLAAGDFNGDQKPDVAVANSGSDNVTILLGDGRGGLRPAPRSPFAAGPRPHIIVVVDFNRDGKADLAVSEHDSNEVRVFLGDGSGGFRAANGSPFTALTRTPPHNHGLSVGDVNADGDPDMVTSNQNDNSVSVLLGDGRGGFAAAPGSPFAVGRDPYPHALGDLNGDGKLDIVTPNVRGNSVSVLLGDGKGGFANAPGSPISVIARPFYVAVGDLNGDGRADMVITHDDTSRITILLGDGGGGFRPAPGSPLDAQRRGGRVLLSDVNGDGKCDAVLAAGSSMVVLLGDGRGGFSQAHGSPYATPSGTWSIALADLNGDGNVEILGTSFENNELVIFTRREP
ncbi:MAG TPA: VCBS repeat-containing protein [Candidatus Acidoferrales bacterium]